jgi:malonyl-CoA O-methyltransferase
MINDTDFHKNKIRQCFNRAAATYDQRSYPQQMIGNNLINLVGKYLSNSATVIDLGCGSGIVTEQLALRLRYQAFHAIDLSDQLISLAHTRLNPLAIQTSQQDFENLNFQSNLFNLVFSNMSLHWVHEFYQMLLNINNAMAKDGMLAFTVPLPGTFTELDSTSRNPFYQFEDLRSHLFNAGFELIECFQETLMFGYGSRLKALISI